MRRRRKQDFWILLIDLTTSAHDIFNILLGILLILLIWNTPA